MQPAPSRRGSAVFMPALRIDPGDVKLYEMHDFRGLGSTRGGWPPW